MLDHVYIVPFLLTAALLSVTPGPGMLYIAAQTIGRGPKAGWYSAIGTHFASYIHIVAAAFGLSLFLQAVPAAYLALKVVGAAYLFWLGLKFLLSEDEPAGPETTWSSSAHKRALRESFVVELTNPKSAVFFIAFLPQFTSLDSGHTVWMQIVVLGAVANVIFSVAEIACVMFADRVASFVRGSRSAGRWMRRTAGSILIALGANLLVSQR